MYGNKQFRNLFLNIIFRVTTAVLAIAVVFALTLVLTQSAQAQTFRVIHSFTGGADGAIPYAGLPSRPQELCTERRRTAELATVAQFSS
jgi:hypothetical protein